MILTVGENEAYQSIGAALAAAKENDVVVVRGGVYHEAIVLSTPGVSVVAADGETAAIDGRYSPALFGDGNYAMSNGRKVGAGQLPSLAADNARRGGWVYSGGNLNINGYSSLVRLVGNGTSISGVTLRNSAGRFIVVEGNDCTIEDCRMDFCYGGAISIARGTVGAVLRRLTVTRSSVKHFDEGAPGAGPDAVATTVICAGTDALIEGNTIAYNYGEGISADKGSVRPVVRNNVIHTNYHWCLGFNNTNGATLEGNIVYWCDNLIEAMDKANPADGFVGGSERASPENPREALAPNMRIVGNLFVGALKRAWLLGSTGRPVQFVDSLIAENTIIGRATPGKPGHTFTWTELKSAPHVNTTVAENVILWEPDTQGISYQAGGGVTWRDNLYSAQPPSGMRDGGDVVTREAVLANPFTPIVGQYDAYAPDMPDTATTFDIDNYRPLAGGAAVGRGALAVEPAEPPVEPPTDPEPPGEPDYEPVIALLEGNLARLEAAGMALGAAVVETHELIDRLRMAAGYVEKESK
jgi:hypothetical protein